MIHWEPFLKRKKSIMDVLLKIVRHSGICYSGRIALARLPSVKKKKKKGGRLIVFDECPYVRRAYL